MELWFHKKCPRCYFMTLFVMCDYYGPFLHRITCLFELEVGGSTVCIILLFYDRFAQFLSSLYVLEPSACDIFVFSVHFWLRIDCSTTIMSFVCYKELK